MEELVPLLVKACQIKQFPKEKNIKKKKKKIGKGKAQRLDPNKKREEQAKRRIDETKHTHPLGPFQAY